MKQAAYKRMEGLTPDEVNFMIRNGWQIYLITPVGSLLYYHFVQYE